MELEMGEELWRERPRLRGAKAVPAAFLGSLTPQFPVSMFGVVVMSGSTVPTIQKRRVDRAQDRHVHRYLSRHQNVL